MEKNQSQCRSGASGGRSNVYREVWRAVSNSHTGDVAVAVVVAEEARLPLAERLALLGAACDELEVIEGPDVRAVLRLANAGVVPYLLDVNRTTSRVAVSLLARHIPYVVDTGDDALSLARNLGLSSVQAHARRVVEGMTLRGAAAVVCRGTVHRLILAARQIAPVVCVRDTVADSVLDIRSSDVDVDLVASFGSIGVPRSEDRAYGWEVIDIVALSDGRLRGLIVGSGPGVDALRSRARRLGVSGRVEFRPWQALDVLCQMLSTAGWITSVQSDDVAGWVRTTGKLPLALGLGRPIVTTNVGEAALVLPKGLRVDAVDSRVIAERMLAVVTKNQARHAELGDEMRELARGFQRSRTATELRSSVLCSLAS